MNVLKVLFAVLVIALLAVIAFRVLPIGLNLGQAPSGLPSAAATSTSRLVGLAAVELFPEALNCATTIIGTKSEPIMISFSGVFDQVGNIGVASSSLSGSIGFVQAASTTVAYDSGLYGCGAVFVISGTANTSIIEAERHN